MTDEAKPPRLSGAARKRENWRRMIAAQAERAEQARKILRGEIAPPEPQPRIARGRQGVKHQ